MSLATIETGSLSFALLGAMFIAKAFVHFVTCLCTYLGASGNQRLGKVGMYAMFATQSNDVAFGVPIIAATFGEEFTSYLFLIAPVQLLFLNVISLVMMELNLDQCSRIASEKVESKDHLDIKAQPKQQDDATVETAQLGESTKEQTRESASSTIVEPAKEQSVMMLTFGIANRMIRYLYSYIGDDTFCLIVLIPL